MVVFTCNNCGETLQKPRVAKHYQFQCRTVPFLSCVDCFKDFRGEEYTAHTRCITEAERYGGKDYVPKANANKGEKKQQEWLNVINNLLANAVDLPPAERGFLHTLSGYENIPRKKAKFMNFVRSALGNRVNMKIVDSVWSKMEAAQKKNVPNGTLKQAGDGQVNNMQDHSQHNRNGKPDYSEENNIAENENNENIVKENIVDSDQRQRDKSLNGHAKQKKDILASNKEKKSKKRAVTHNNVEETEESVAKKKKKPSECIESLESSVNECEKSVENTKFDWKNTILTILQKKGELSLKKLQKKAITKYMNECPNEVTYEKASAKFNKKLKKVADIIVSEERVKLVEV